MGASEWLKIRTLDGSQPAAFEELCCQLAAQDRPSSGSRYERKGQPDAGLECLWRLENGEERGWQAKYFTASLGPSQWQQIDDSVKSALEKHPQLMRLTICCAVDLADARSPNKAGARDKWNRHVAKWTCWASARGRPCEFIYWGSSELHERLSRDDNRGKRRYFFDDEVFSPDWFDTHLSAQYRVAGPRYSPELHVEVEIGKTLRSAVRGESLHREWHDSIRELAAAAGRLYWGGLNRSLQRRRHAITRRASSIVEMLATVDLRPPARIRVEEYITALDEFDGVLEAANDHLLRSGDRLRGSINRQHGVNPYDAAERELYAVMAALRALQRFLSGDRMQAANGVPLLIRGEAGVGKTHTLCDAAAAQRVLGAPVILAFGGQFRDRGLLPQFCERFGVSFRSYEDLLGAISADAERARAPALMIIDALNDAIDRSVWNKELPGLIQAVQNFPWVRLIVSIRTPFESLYITEHVCRTMLPVTHPGFGDAFTDAALKFFEHWKLEGMRTPPLLPEFQNPLFLKLYCQAMSTEASSHVGGSIGLTRLFDQFIRYVHGVVAERGAAGFDPGAKQIRDVLDELAAWLVDNGTRTCPRDVAKSIVNTHSPPAGEPFERTLFAQLIEEGVLVEDWYYDHASNHGCEAIGFGYHRFTDFLRARRVLSDLKDEPSLRLALASDGLIGQALARYWDPGLYTALAVMLAEEWGIELVDHVLPKSCESYLESVVWRRADAIPGRVSAWIIESALSTERYQNPFLETVLRLALSPNHPLNADALHVELAGMALPERDIRWTIPCQEASQWADDTGPLQLLIRWAWCTRDHRRPEEARYSDEALRLAGTVLVWCFTFSNRYLRDGATKACVELLSRRPKVLGELIHRFHEANDPYVLERLAAVGLGVGVRQLDKGQITLILDTLRSHFFESRDPPANQLFRFYVHRLVAYARSRGVDGHEQLCGPFQSYLRRSPPPLGELKTKFGEVSRGFGRIASSVTSGDFGVYVAKLPCSPGTLRKRPGLRAGVAPGRIQESGYLARWILRRVLELGWRPGYFDAYDSGLPYESRMTHRQERIGKKYQWIAWRELLARLGDTYAVPVGASSWHSASSDPWTDRARLDIDPTVILHQKRGRSWQQVPSTWWKPMQYDRWLPLKQRRRWVRFKSDIPDLRSGLRVLDPRDQSAWIALSVYYTWEAPDVLTVGRKAPHRPTLYLLAFGYLIRRADEKAMREWAQGQWFYGRWMPEGGHIGSLLGEYPIALPNTDDCGWINAEPYHQIKAHPGQVLPLRWEYMWDSGYDASIDGALSINLMTPYLGRQLPVTHRFVDGRLFDRGGQLVVQDPSVFEDGPETVLVKESFLRDQVLRGKYSIMWIVMGEKHWIGSDPAKYVGHREITGAYFYDGSGIAGGMASRLWTETGRHSS